MPEKIGWQEAEKNFVKKMEANKEVLLVEHISFFAQNSEWDVLVDLEKWSKDSVLSKKRGKLKRRKHV